jgi:hypothetical protein
MTTRRGFLKLTGPAALALAAGRVPAAAAARYDEGTVRQARSSPPVVTTGQIRNISARKADGSYYVMRDVDPCPNKSCIYYQSTGGGMMGIFDWCGGDYVPDESDPGHGFFGITGFGHDSGYANIFPIFSTRAGRWLPVNTPYPAGRNTTFDEWGNWDGKTGQMATGHSYGHIRPLPKSVGGGEKGSFLVLRGAAVGRAATAFDATHRFDIATNRFSLFAGHLDHGPNSQPQTPCAFDWVHGRYLQVSGMGAYVNILDPRSPADVETPHGKVRRWKEKRIGNVPNWQWAKMAEYVPWLNMLIVLHQRDAAGSELWACKPYDDNSYWVNLGPLPLDTGLQWGAPSLTACSPKKAIAMYRGLGMRNLFWVEVGHRFGAQCRIGGTEVFGGEAPAWKLGTNGVDAIYNRLAWVPDRRAFLFLDGVESPVQEFQPAGV